ncbi:MAG TPA: hypothetical protein VFK39_15840 [Gemmatimonadaceae bacterium]|nr:hypothetical protein [Gemmatimonadaceae bacterium]
MLVNAVLAITKLAAGLVGNTMEPFEESPPTFSGVTTPGKSE